MQLTLIDKYMDNIENDMLKALKELAGNEANPVKRETINEDYFTSRFETDGNQPAESNEFASTVNVELMYVDLLKAGMLALAALDDISYCAEIGVTSRGMLQKAAAARDTIKELLAPYNPDVLDDPVVQFFNED